MSLVEAVPNVSDGRRPWVIDACRDALRTAGTSVLDVHSDPDHHRSVFTCAGQPAELALAVMALYERAIAAIDLREHTGVHPRIGAVDVLPFVPLAGVSMADCAALARTVAEGVARRFDLPVYLYEAAAARPERRRLDVIRRGGFEGLAQRMRLPDWAPDFGPSSPHPSAGATVIGARHLLIAFNVDLDTDDLDVARAVAATVRERSGGLPGIRALGVPLAHRGTAQVTINVTNFRVTSLTEVFDRVSAEADRHGVRVSGSEIVGLVPAAALPPDPASRLKLRGFSASQILERRLEETGRPGPWLTT